MHEHEEKPKHPHEEKCEPKEPVATTQADEGDGDDNGTDPRNNGGHNG